MNSSSPDQRPTDSRQALAAIISAAMEQMDAPERQTLILADMHGLSYEEVARRMGVPRATVQARLSRARVRLRDYLLTHQEHLPACYRFTSPPLGVAGQETRGAKSASKM